MGTLAGAIRLDARAADRALSGRMSATLAHRGRCSTFDGTESSGPQIAFDGRIDNRGELTTALDLAVAPPDDQLALAAYRAWGDGCAARLDGDFAFAIWDPAAGVLLCARDIVGVKPFFYAVAGGTFVFASELHALFQHPAVTRTPNEGMVAELLNDSLVSREETLFRDVRRLPPAHLLRLHDGSLAQRRYWRPTVRPVQSVADDAECASELKSILQAAVGSRVDRPRAAAQLSGGLDSSAVVAIAATLPDAPAVHTYSLVFPGEPFDESGHIADVVGSLGVRSTALRVPAWDVEWFAAQAERYLECPLGPTAGVLAGMYAAVRGDGFSSMLTGEGADEWFSGSMQGYADLLARGALLDVGDELLRAPRRSVALRRILVGGVWPLLPRRMRDAIRPAARALRAGGRIAEWIEPALARRTALEDRCRRREYDAKSGMTRATWDIAEYLNDARQALAFEIADRISARSCIEERHPFYDRRVIEFALSLPESQRTARGVRKRVLREAMRGLLPDAVRQRADKADFTRMYLDWFAGVGGESVFDRLAIAEAGWVRADVLAREYRRAMTAIESGGDAPALPALWTAVALDGWFRAAVDGGALAVRGAGAPS